MSNPQDPYHNLFRNKSKGQRYKVNRRLNKTKAEEADKMIEEWKKKTGPFEGVEKVKKSIEESKKGRS